MNQFLVKDTKMAQTFTEALDLCTPILQKLLARVCDEVLRVSDLEFDRSTSAETDCRNYSGT